MRKNKTQKGITLIALIITIVVLLILAVVAIRAVQGDGIIARAKEATSKYTEAQAEEKLELGMQSYRLAHNGNFDANDFVSNVGTYVDGATGSGAIVTVDGYNINVVGKTANWSTEPTAGTWYVSDDCLIWDGDTVTGFRSDFDWCANVNGSDTTGYPTYAIYMSKMAAEVGTTKVVFSENVNKIGNGSNTYDDFGRLYLLCYYNNISFEFLSETVELQEGFLAGHASGLSEYTVPTNFKVLPNYFFAGCIDLTNLTIPSTVTSISDSAFTDIGASSSGDITIHVVEGSVADAWAKTQQLSNSNIVIDYII